jgi:hypothetical protein
MVVDLGENSDCDEDNDFGVTSSHVNLLEHVKEVECSQNEDIHKVHMMQTFNAL